MAAGSKITQTVMDMVLPLANEQGCSVYDVEYKKQGADYVLSITLDSLSEDTPVSIAMCENVSRALSDLLDNNDPIKDPYMLEVSSPGLDRPLKKDEDFVRFAGKTIEVGLYRQLNGSKLLSGTLMGLNDGVISLKTDSGDVEIKREEASFVRLAVIF